jgi:hypothetical protein
LQCVEAYQDHQEKVHRITKDNFHTAMEEAINQQYIEDRKVIETMGPIETKNLTVIFCRICKKMFGGKKEYRNHFETDTDHLDKYEYAKKNNVHHEMIGEGIGFAKGPKFEAIEKKRYCICFVCDKHFSGELIILVLITISSPHSCNNPGSQKVVIGQKIFMFSFFLKIIT